MRFYLTRPWIKALAGLCINLSAGWFGLAIITPNFSELSETEALLVLTRDVFFGILFLYLTVKLEEYLS